MPSNEEILARISTQFVGPHQLGKIASTGAGCIALGATVIASSLIKFNSGSSLVKQTPLLAVTALCMACTYFQKTLIKQYDEKLTWDFEQNTLAKLSKEYTKGLYEMYEKDRRTNVLAYKLAGSDKAKKKIDSNGNTKGLTIAQTEKIAYFRNQLIAQGGEVPEIKDQLDDEDEFYF